MKIYKISQSINNDYDTYDSAIVYAQSEEEAKQIHPESKNSKFLGCYYLHNWALPKNVKVEYIGENPEITEKGVFS